jgi:exonuclease V gamma subunit
MKTIEEASKKYAQISDDKATNNTIYFSKCDIADAFKKGVEFAQQWISIEEDKPEIKEEPYFVFVIRINEIQKYDCFEIGEFITNQYTSIEKYLAYWNITHWRPIDRK